MPVEPAISNPLVTIIIPAHNSEHYIGATLQSVLAQNYLNWHALVINNYSKDSTLQVIKSFADPRIEVLDFGDFVPEYDFTRFGIIASVRNFGIDRARGKYIAFLDADDLWEANKLDRCVSLLEKNELDLICHGEIYFVDETKPLRKGDKSTWQVDYGPTSKSRYDRLLLEGNCFSTSAVVCKTEVVRRLGGFDESRLFFTVEDYELWLRIMAAGAKVEIISEVLGRYRIYPESSSADLELHYTGAKNVLLWHYHRIFKKSYPGIWNRLKFFYNYYRRLLVTSLVLIIKRRNLKGGLDLFFRSLNMSTPVA